MPDLGTTTLTQLAARKVATNLAIAAAAATLALVAPQPDLVNSPMIIGTSDRLSDTRGAGPVQTSLLEANHCWAGEAPARFAGTIPGHVAVSRGDRVFLGGPRVVDQALEQVFDGVDHGLTVYGFCP